MKLIIDIDESTYKRLKEYYDAGNYGPVSEFAIANGTPLPDNATNGDVIKALFSIQKEKYTDYGTVKIYGVDSEKMPVEFLADWWNAPYKLSKLKGE